MNWLKNIMQNIAVAMLLCLVLSLLTLMIAWPIVKAWAVLKIIFS